MKRSAGAWITPTAIALAGGIVLLGIIVLRPRTAAALPPPAPGPMPGTIPETVLTQPLAQRPDRQPVPIPALTSEEIFKQVIRTMQTQLKALGYRITTIDGVVTPGGPTEAAIRAFARLKHLPLTQGIDSARTIASAVDDEYGTRFPNGAPV